MSLGAVAESRPDNSFVLSLAPHASAPAITPIPPANTQQWRRRISPPEGRALEILGHAIDYLADEFAFHSGSLSSLHSHDPQVQAIQLLMAANRQVYFSCPLIPPFGVRLMNALSGRSRRERLLSSVQ
jgi:hypothetical protein